MNGRYHDEKLVDVMKEGLNESFGEDQYVLNALMPDNGLGAFFVYEGEPDLFGVTKGELLMEVRTYDDEACDIRVLNKRANDQAIEFSKFVAENHPENAWYAAAGIAVIPAR